MSQQRVDNVCPSCGSATQPDQRFCNSCGMAQPVTVPMSAIAPGSALPPPDPAADPEAFDQMFETDRFRVVEQVTPTQEQIGMAWDPSVVPDGPGMHTAEAPVLGVPQRYRMALVVLSSLTAVVAVVASVVTVASYHVTGDIAADLTMQVNGFTSNALVGSIIAAVLLLVGAVVGMRGDRAGLGLAGGAGLAISGLMAWMVGQAVSLIDTVKQAMRVRGGNYRLVSTLDIGWWLALVAALLGGVVFVIAVTGLRDDGGRRVHPAVGSVGVLGTLCVVLGPMLPMHTGTLADNFNSAHAVGATRFGKAWVLITLGVLHQPVPPVTTFLRLLMLVLLGLGGVVGFLMASRWGLGLAIGSISIALWQWITSVANAGARPFGIAGGNPGSNGITPHFLTTIGIVVTLVALAAYLALLLPRRPRT